MKNYFIIILSFYSFLIYSQEYQSDCITKSQHYTSVVHNDKNAIVIWSEDFSNGFPVGWNTYSINTQTGNNGTSLPMNMAENPWKHSFSGSWGYWNGEPKDVNNNPINASDALLSTTSSNGFLISDPDSANHWSGNFGGNSGSTYSYIESYFITSAINTIGYPNINLEFEQKFRLNNSVDLIVSVSADSISWTDFSVKGNIGNNQHSADPENVSLNISCVAGDQATVYIKVGWSARVYYWMIDDMKIVESPENNLELIEANYGGWYTTPIANGFGLEYTMTPLNQAIANPYTFEGIVTNTGGNDQLTKLNVEVFDNLGTSVFTSSSADSMILSQDINCNMDTVIFVANNKFTPSSVGTYSFNTWASSPDTSSVMISSEAIVTDSVYSRDDGVDYSEYGLGRSCGGMIIGSYFDIYSADDVTSISVFLKDNSVVGSKIFVELYEIDSNNDKLMLTQSDDYTLQSSDLGNWVDIKLISPYNVAPGSYMAAVGGYAHPFDTTIIGMSKYTWNSTCYIQKNGCLNSGQSFGSWYWLSRAPMIRLNMGDASASNINNLINNKYFNIYPNPSKGEFKIQFTNPYNKFNEINIRDLLGRIVYTTPLNSDIVYIDASTLEKGQYLLELSNSENMITEKIIIN